jgi:chemotaxis protein MotA
MTYAWVRESTLNEPDPDNMTDRMVRGWAPVPAARHSEMVPPPLPGHEGMEAMVIRRGGLILCERFTEDVEISRQERDIENMEQRHKANADIFTQAGTYAPTLGVLGAVIGLIAALKDLSDIEKLGHAISAAFVATLFGIFTGYVLWFPFANKLKQYSKSEVIIKEMMIEGILSIQSGESPKTLEDKLSVYLSPKERAVYEAQKEA